jgi:hypothetical protein
VRDRFRRQFDWRTVGRYQVGTLELSDEQAADAQRFAAKASVDLRPDDTGFPEALNSRIPADVLEQMRAQWDAEEDDDGDEYDTETIDEDDLRLATLEEIAAREGKGRKAGAP